MKLTVYSLLLSTAYGPQPMVRFRPRSTTSPRCGASGHFAADVVVYGPLPPTVYSLRPTVGGLSAAFSLVEVTLALMVMAIGILSIMSLFPAGLDQNARSIADTHAAFFAEEVFAGLHAAAETNWDGLAEVQLPVASSNMWDSSLFVYGTNYPGFTTNIYSYTPDTPGSPSYYEDHALRYRLVVMTNGLLKTATLFVWPGEFGSTNTPSMFYAEFFRWKP